MLQGQNQGLFVGFCFEGTTIEDQSVKAFCCTKIDVSATTLSFLKFLSIIQMVLYIPGGAGFLNHQQ